MVRLSSSNYNWLLRSFPWLRTQKAPWLSQWRLLSNLSNLAEHSITYLCALLLLASSTPFLYVIGCWALCFEMSNCSFISFQVCFGTHNKLDRMICVVLPLPPTLPLHLQRSPGKWRRKRGGKCLCMSKPSWPAVSQRLTLNARCSLLISMLICAAQLGRHPISGEDIYVNLICAGLFSKAPSPSNGDYFHWLHETTWIHTEM